MSTDALVLEDGEAPPTTAASPSRPRPMSAKIKNPSAPLTKSQILGYCISWGAWGGRGLHLVPLKPLPKITVGDAKQDPSMVTGCPEARLLPQSTGTNKQIRRPPAVQLPAASLVDKKGAKDKEHLRFVEHGNQATTSLSMPSQIYRHDLFSVAKRAMKQSNDQLGLTTQASLVITPPGL